MKKIGITGGIGSGKTMVCRVFAALGVPVYYADAAARRLIDTRQDIREELIELLGEGIYGTKGLNRPYFASFVFRDEKLLERTNRIIHPRVREDFLDWAGKQTGHVYVIEETAILFESGANRLMDKIITVVSPPEIRIARLLKREGMTLERIQDIMNQQWPDKAKIRLSDYTLYNDEKNLIFPQLFQLHQEFSAL